MSTLPEGGALRASAVRGLMARLIPALCPQCGGHVTLDPAKEWVTCTYCRATSFIETPGRRHAPNHPKAGIAVIRVATPPSEHARRAVLVAMLLCTIGTLVPIVSIALFNARGLTVLRGISRDDDRSDGEVVAPPAPQVDYFRDATSLRALVESSVEPNPQVVGVTLGVSYATFDVAVSPALDAFDTITIQGGSVDGRRPMLIPPKPATVGPRLVRLADLDLTLVPRLIADASSRLATAVPRGKVVNVTVSSMALPGGAPASMAWQGRPSWTVLIRNERHVQGIVSYDLRGTFLRQVTP